MKTAYPMASLEKENTRKKRSLGMYHHLLKERRRKNTGQLSYSHYWASWAKHKFGWILPQRACAMITILHESDFQNWWLFTWSYITHIDTQIDLIDAKYVIACVDRSQSGSRSSSVEISRTPPLTERPILVASSGDWETPTPVKLAHSSHHSRHNSPKYVLPQTFFVKVCKEVEVCKRK